jgi:hypothetical protein
MAHRATGNRLGEMQLHVRKSSASTTSRPAIARRRRMRGVAVPVETGG